MFLPHAHRISLLSPAPVSHIFHSCRPSMPRKQKAALVPTPIKQSHEAMVVSYRPQTLHDTIHTVLPGEVLPAIPSYLEFIAVRLFVFQLTASRRGWRPVLLHSSCRVSYFNSQPYEEADLPPVPREHSLDISTHSLTKRLTSDIWHTEFFHRYFNSQPHEEADSNRPYENDDEHISTHSLTKRLTNYLVYYRSADTAFQLTASRRGWRSLSAFFRSPSHFNSQPHEEADDSGTGSVNLSDISTHSLTKRLTLGRLKERMLTVFQLTASRRGWRSSIL